MKHKKTHRMAIRGWLVLLLVFPFVLWWLPADFFDNGAIILCPSRFFLGLECLGCGITRAVMHFHHLEFEVAAHYNALVFGVYPLLVYLWGRWLYAAWNLLTNREEVIPSGLR